jgi:hypothetical protein
MASVRGRRMPKRNVGSGRSRSNVTRWGGIPAALGPIVAIVTRVGDVATAANATADLVGKGGAQVRNRRGMAAVRRGWSSPGIRPT